METTNLSPIPGTSEHTSKQFDAELGSLRNKILEIGGLVEIQVQHAIHGIYNHDQAELDAVVLDERKIALLEQEVDAACNRIIARRQPAAIDLRMILSVLKGLSDLERVSHKAMKIARMGERLDSQHNAFLPPVDLRPMADHTLKMLRLSLDAFARLDTALAAQVVRMDQALNDEHDGIVRQVITFMMEDPRTISRAMDLLNVSKALERIGDHAKSMAEHVIYTAKGLNVQHASADEIEKVLQENA